MMIQGNLQILNDPFTCTEISNAAKELIENPVWQNNEIQLADCILKMSNIAYNNTSADVLIIDDGLYDQLLVIYNPLYRIYSK